MRSLAACEAGAIHGLVAVAGGRRDRRGRGVREAPDSTCLRRLHDVADPWQSDDLRFGVARGREAHASGYKQRPRRDRLPERDQRQGEDQNFEGTEVNAIRKIDPATISANVDHGTWRV